MADRRLYLPCPGRQGADQDRDAFGRLVDRDFDDTLPLPPMTSSPEMPAPIWNSISLRNAASSNASALVKGVTIAV
jgi:hypothetical protein